MKDRKYSSNTPRFDADQNYRERLAAVIIAQRESVGPHQDEVKKLFNVKTFSYEPKALERSDTELELEQRYLSSKLKEHPDMQSRFAQLTQYTTSKWLLEQELKARGAWTADSFADAYEEAKKVQSVGVCLSGGGIRSATFNLGVLQGLARLGKLRKIDYLSTVSGGGYIHQFLSAWICREGLDKVQSKLNPIPTPGSARVTAPEPLRWLRRYSNYLSPSVSIFGADIWTIATVWVRNTLLNLVILISAMTTLLLLPHFAITDFALRPIALQPLQARLVLWALACLCALAASGLLWHSFPRFCAKAEDRAEPDPKCRKDTTRNWHPWAIVMLWLSVSSAVAPAVYRLSVPGGRRGSGEAQRAYFHRPEVTASIGQIALRSSGLSATAQWTVCSDKDEACPSGNAISRNRFKAAWRDDKLRPHCLLPAFLLWEKSPCVAYRAAYRDHFLISNKGGFPGEAFYGWLFDVFPLLCFLFCTAVWFGHKETAKGWNKWLSPLYPLAGGLFSAVLVYGIELLFFAATFAIPQNLITSLGIALLPPLLLTVPFVSLELCTGLMGRLFGSAQREWVARLRAVSIQVGFTWMALVGLSLIGPFVFEQVAKQAAVKYTVWGTWLVSTISGVLLGKSKSTNGKPKEGTQDTGEKQSSWSLSELIIKVAPPVFVIGLFVLLATYASWLLRGPLAAENIESLKQWAFLTALMFVTAVVFSLRIDINEFSMNAFYRDRLARCYAGASNPDRQPNRFTGFDVRDGALRVSELLPKTWAHLNDTNQATTDQGKTERATTDKATTEKKMAEHGTYDGPFPIFCTALNLTTGRDLAYQERKAASFAITPLFSGYSTGWTEGTDCSMVYNGFIPTTQHIKSDSKGITVASAVAISGAAASPNMGFHSNTAMAFLMTIFNVRLGWWIRNPRRQAPDSPLFGLWQLGRELMGSTNDTSPFVYISDGGHFENMGLHELLRRRCRTIIVCDAEADGSLCFEGIGMAIRKARLDFGVEIKIKGVVDDRPLSEDGNPKSEEESKAKPEEGVEKLASAIVSALGNANKEHPSGAEGLLQFKHFPGNLFHALEADIIYPEDQEGAENGKLLYLKSTLTGDEPIDILNYHRVHSSFPFDTTLNQFFTESQFESYRRLGEHIVLETRVKKWIEKL